MSWLNLYIKKTVQVLKNRYSKKKSYNFQFHKTMSHDLLVQMAYVYAYTDFRLNILMFAKKHKRNALMH